jgi:DNA-binding transcriptional MerR regulator
MGQPGLRVCVKESLLTLKDMTRGSGCTPRTVRYYERQGLLRAMRSTGGHRLFAATELHRLRFIISLREAGWSLEEVEEFLELRTRAKDDAEACARIDAILAAQAERLRRKIELLEQLRQDLASTASLLLVCGQCTSVQPRVDCTACDRVPDLEQLPRAFRLVWRGGEVDTRATYDELGADGDELVADLDGADPEAIP